MLSDIAKLADDCVDNYLSKENANQALMRIDISPERITQSDVLSTYFTNIIKHLIASDKLQDWLETLSHKPFIYIFPTNWFEIKQKQLPCPYRGLFHFREEDAGFFFGRGKFIQDLLKATLQKTAIAVVGNSGSGKSSVVFAGLIPRLRREKNCIVSSFRPGTTDIKSPFRGLAKSLVQLLHPQMT